MSIVALNLTLTKKELDILSDFRQTTGKSTSALYVSSDMEEIVNTITEYINRFVNIAIIEGRCVDNIVFDIYNEESGEESVICSECAKKHNIPKTALEPINDAKTLTEFKRCGIIHCNNEPSYKINFGYTHDKKPVFFNYFALNNIDINAVDTEPNTATVEIYNMLIDSKDLSFICSALSAIFNTNIDTVEKLENAIHIAISKFADTQAADIQSLKSFKNKMFDYSDMELHYGDLIFDSFGITGEHKPMTSICSECLKNAVAYKEEKNNLYEFENYEGATFCGVKGCYNKRSTFISFEDNEKVEIRLSSDT